MSTVAALQSGYEGLWEIPHDQVQQQSSSSPECPSETASPPSYNHTAPPPPYTAHARLGEVSIHRSYHYEPPPQENELITGSHHDHAAVDSSWLNDTTQEVIDNVSMRDDAEQQVAMDTSGQTSVYDDQPNVDHHPLVTSTPSSSLHELQHSTNSNIFVKSLSPLPQSSNLPPVKAIPRLRPIRPQALSAPNLFASYPPPVTCEMDSPLNNTLPRVGHLPPLRRKPCNMINNSSSHTRSLSDGRLPSPFYDNHQTLSRSISTGECGPISEVTYEPSSSDTIDNL